MAIVRLTAGADVHEAVIERQLLQEATAYSVGVTGAVFRKTITPYLKAAKKSDVVIMLIIAYALLRMGPVGRSLASVKLATDPSITEYEQRYMEVGLRRKWWLPSWYRPITINTDSTWFKISIDCAWYVTAAGLAYVLAKRDALWQRTEHLSPGHFPAHTATTCTRLWTGACNPRSRKRLATKLK
jgi:hypothetical protein